MAPQMKAGEQPQRQTGFAILPEIGAGQVTDFPIEAERPCLEDMYTQPGFQPVAHRMAVYIVAGTDQSIQDASARAESELRHTRLVKPRSKAFTASSYQIDQANGEITAVGDVDQHSQLHSLYPRRDIGDGCHLHPADIVCDINYA